MAGQRDARMELCPRNMATTSPVRGAQKAWEEILEDETEWQSTGPECLKKKFQTNDKVFEVELVTSTYKTK